ncbi:hypothetical protein NB724_000544 [Pantoea ananatis]|nr:hypothetical protein [Pantoea ananatis]MCW0333038.1 hypothetical protein [Pantoea ananatis]MCW0381712.1 hypothetical protein [Pantoea ananatis]MCW0406377.1 hypothetical protein [Pantoea ananatis]MCW0426551.1 hypothetical protein [Pantoea ananatis]
MGFILTKRQRFVLITHKFGGQPKHQAHIPLFLGRMTVVPRTKLSVFCSKYTRQHVVTPHGDHLFLQSARRI